MIRHTARADSAMNCQALSELVYSKFCSGHCVLDITWPIWVLEGLIEQGDLSVHSTVAARGDNFSTLLTGAAKNGREDTVATLLRNRANVDCMGWSGLLHYHPPEQKTALRLSIENRNYNITKMLLDHHADVNLKFKDQMSAIHFAAISTNCADVLSSLCKAKADLSAEDSRGRQPLHYAAKHNNDQFLNFIFKSNIDFNVNAQSHFFGYTALHLACQESHISTVQALLHQKCDTNLHAHNGTTPLHNSIDSSIAHLLIQNKADVNAHANHDYTPLHWFAARSNFDMVQLTINAKAHVNAVDSDGANPLHWAIIRSSCHVISLLINAKCDVKNSSQSALHMAHHHNRHQDVIDLLTPTSGCPFQHNCTRHHTNHLK